MWTQTNRIPYIRTPNKIPNFQTLPYGRSHMVRAQAGEVLGALLAGQLRGCRGPRALGDHRRHDARGWRHDRAGDGQDVPALYEGLRSGDAGLLTKGLTQRVQVPKYRVPRVSIFGIVLMVLGYTPCIWVLGPLVRVTRKGLSILVRRPLEVPLIMADGRER